MTENWCLKVIVQIVAPPKDGCQTQDYGIEMEVWTQRTTVKQQSCIFMDYNSVPFYKTVHTW